MRADLPPAVADGGGSRYGCGPPLLRRVSRSVSSFADFDLLDTLAELEAGREGVVINFITERDQPLLAKLEKVKARA